MEGVVRTRAGYCGGTKKDPSYYSLGDHTETLEIDYDPHVVSYNELLEVFWNYHNPFDRPISKQYASFIFYNNEEQRNLAYASREKLEKEIGKKIHTQVELNTGFYLAEGYHQKYYLQQVRVLMEEFKKMYPNTLDFINSTQAARVNGYIRGYGSTVDLQAELPKLNLYQRASQRLLEIVEGYGR
jgi:peptide-methionine (S)-S-oxide reductase